MIRKLIYILPLFLLFSCSPSWRLAHLVKRHPELLTKDTLTVKDTIIRPAIHHDTSFHVSKDTVVIKKENLTTKIYYNNDTIYVSNSLPADTVIKTFYVPYEKVTTGQKKPWYKLSPFEWILTAGVILNLLILILPALVGHRRG